MPSLTLQQAFDLAIGHHQAGRLAEAERLYRQILAQQPAHADALHFLGVIAHQVGRNDLAVELIRRAISLNPNYVDAYNNLGIALKEKGEHNEAIDAYRKAIALRPNYAEAYNNLGVALAEKGRLVEAIAAYRQAIVLRPNNPEALSNFGNALRATGRLDEAIAAHRQSIAVRPDYAEAHCNLGAALGDNGQIEESIAAHRQAIDLNPNSVKAQSNLGVSLKDNGQIDDAIMAFRRAIALDGACAEAHSNLGMALAETGRLDEGIAAWRQALIVNPSYVQAYSNLLYMLHFHPDYGAERIAEEHRRWARQYAEPLRGSIKAHVNDRSPDRRLRLGYVSPHFRSHATSFFTAPLLMAHDHAQFEIYCYCDARRADEVTARLKTLADVWRPIRGMTDDQLADLIRQDKIDILIDLTMHMADGRPLLLRKPAPVQVAWLAYPGTTGLSTMDYRLTDPYLDPPGLNDAHYSEISCRLPDTALCYAPLTTEPGVNALPALANGYITFGSLNNFCKANDRVLQMWSAALAAVPGSRMLVLAPRGSPRQRLEQFVADAAGGSPSGSLAPVLGGEGWGEGLSGELRHSPIGPSPQPSPLRTGARESPMPAPSRATPTTAVVDPARIEWLDRRPRQQYLEYFHRIDIVLDAWPYNGETTSLDGLWMGVPMVTLCGQTAPSRAGLCYCTHLGLTDLVAQTPQEYVQIAARLAGDLPRLAELRATLRSRMERSPLMDAPRFARNVEAAYRQMWRRHCETDTQKS